MTMMTHRQLAEEGHGTARPQGLRRGACPTLFEPMQTGDGLLARLRPPAGTLSLRQFSLLAAAAERLGNGLLEITARGSLQVRGLRQETASQFAHELEAAGFPIPAGPAIELSPLHGIAPGEIENPAQIEAMLRETFASQLTSPLLAPKLSILLDGGGRDGASSLFADIRIIAAAPARWQLAIDGNGKNAVPLLTGDADACVQALGDLLDLLISLGRHRRCRDIPRAELLSMFPLMPTQDLVDKDRADTSLIGYSPLADGSLALGLRPRFGQIRADQLLAFITRAEAMGAGQARLGPGRVMLLVGLSAQAASEIAAIAVDHGLSGDRDDPSAHIAACAGAGGCASGCYNTRKLAEALITSAPDLFDGSMVIHLSGCAKGCAWRSHALTLVGASDGSRLILDGSSLDAPDAQIAGGAAESAIESIARFIKNERRAGESARSCLSRVGKAAVIRALRQE
ncbi:precorrin-3B synthase [Rhizobium grahamii]|uniref:Putative precorrin-3b synthase n=1 Tax=Rhizobium grahamii CCGE 502 TaxID=990285 RepID=S3H8R4_9HYPH|nr:precorrin-3B synthase [Rhizobium grahamii]EPE94989.1 putative precorrin-3b synthase [Rhizobium grahamii CCGE 502]